jgi:twitching motility protein PilU
MIGESRDKEVMEAALRYADTGHLCLTTLHATNANQTLDRVLHFFPSEAHNQVLMDLSLNLNCILAQRLVKTEDGTRVVAVEVLVNTPYISKLIREGNFNEIKEIMAKGSETGMKTFDQSLFDLFKERKIDLQAALANADSSSDLEWKINFGDGLKELHGKEEKLEALRLPSGEEGLDN